MREVKCGDSSFRRTWFSGAWSHQRHFTLNLTMSLLGCEDKNYFRKLKFGTPLLGQGLWIYLLPYSLSCSWKTLFFSYLLKLPTGEGWRQQCPYSLPLFILSHSDGIFHNSQWTKNLELKAKHVLSYLSFVSLNSCGKFVNSLGTMYSTNI